MRFEIGLIHKHFLIAKKEYIKHYLTVDGFVYTRAIVSLFHRNVFHSEEEAANSIRAVEESIKRGYSKYLKQYSCVRIDLDTGDITPLAVVW